MVDELVGVMSEVETVAIDNGSSSSNSKGASQGVRVAIFYHWKYSHYFEVVDEGDKNLKARCTLCSASAKPLSCARNTTFNFKKHLDSVHKNTKLVAISPEEKVGAKHKRSAADNGDKEPKRQAMLQKRSVSPEASNRIHS